MSSILFRIRLFLVNRFRGMLNTVLLLIAVGVGVVGIFQLEASKRLPLPVTAKVLVFNCDDVLPKTVIRREDLEKCITEVALKAEPGVSPPGRSELPKADAYMVLSPLRKGQVVSLNELIPYAEDFRFVAVKIDPVYARSEKVMLHIRDERAVQLAGQLAVEGTVTGGTADSAQVVSNPVYQVMVEGECRVVIGDYCIYVPEKAQLLDADGKPIRELSEDTTYALLSEYSAIGLRDYGPAPKPGGGGPLPIP